MVLENLIQDDEFHTEEYIIQMERRLEILMLLYDAIRRSVRKRGFDTLPPDIKATWLRVKKFVEREE